MADLDSILGYRPVTIDGHDLYVHVTSGRVVPAIRGGADGDPPPDPPAPPASFTQADLDRLVGQARTEARRTAANDLAAQLGCTPEEAKAKLDALAAAEEARKDDLQKAQDAAAAAAARAEAAEAAAATTEARANATTALIAAGLPATAIADGLRLIDLDADDLDAEATALAERLPALFATDDNSGPPAPPAGITPPKPPAGKGGGQSADERAKARFEQWKSRNPQPAA